jgi:hypothetical protein
MQVAVLDSERESPVDIVQVSRGSWGGPLDEDLMHGEFVQDDENGKIAVLVTW